MDKEASTSGVRVYFTIPFVTPSLGGIMIFLFPDSKSKANADKSISLQKFVPTQNPNPLYLQNKIKKFHIVLFLQYELYVLQPYPDSNIHLLCLRILGI